MTQDPKQNLSGSGHDLGSERDPGSERIRPPPFARRPEDVESPDVWGYRDSAFAVNTRGHVELKGSRYSLSGHELPSLLPWMAETLAVELDPNDLYPPRYPTKTPPSRAEPALIASLRHFLKEDQIVDGAEPRLRHGHGHTQEEMYAIKYEELGRIPDLVVYPESREQVVKLVELASERSLCLIPYGGGTNVTDALRCPENEVREILSVDLSRMNRIVWIDPTNRMACIEAGAVGSQIQEQLEEYGFTLGHEPDSVEFSTLGGWIATRASGMKRNRYGNIEDIVLDVEAVTATGVLSRHQIAPRESVGSDLKQWLLGSEGTLGIVTRAVVKLFPMPEVTRYGSILFPDFERGVRFLDALTRSGSRPASVRLVDNAQFRFGQALKPRTSGWRAKRRGLERWWVTRVRGYSPDKMTACTLLFEGTATEVRDQSRAVYRLARRHGGMPAGAENGKRGYELTFGIAYIRDFALNHYVLGESFETSVPWSQLLSLCDNVRQRLWEEHAKRGLPGRPFVTCRVTQLYETGVCVYFYFAYYFKGIERPSEIYAEMEQAAREEILRSGGSLSHHHGVGKLRQRFLPSILSPAALAWRRAAKGALDPRNIFGSANQGV